MTPTGHPGRHILTEVTLRASALCPGISHGNSRAEYIEDKRSQHARSKVARASSPSTRRPAHLHGQDARTTFAARAAGSRDAKQRFFFAYFLLSASDPQTAHETAATQPNPVTQNNGFSLLTFFFPKKKVSHLPRKIPGASSLISKSSGPRSPWILPVISPTIDVARVTSFSPAPTPTYVTVCAP